MGTVEAWEARNARLEAAWVYANGGFTKSEAIGLVSSTLAELLGLDERENVKANGWVAYEGDFFNLDARVRAVSSPDGQSVDLF